MALERRDRLSRHHVMNVGIGNKFVHSLFMTFSHRAQHKRNAYSLKHTTYISLANQLVSKSVVSRLCAEEPPIVSRPGRASLKPPLFRLRAFQIDALHGAAELSAVGFETLVVLRSNLAIFVLYLLHVRHQGQRECIHSISRAVWRIVTFMSRKVSPDSLNNWGRSIRVTDLEVAVKG